MDHLWTPWRYRYIAAGSHAAECIFCAKAADTDDRANYIVLRANRNFILLNLYPYTNGHLMVAPYEHVSTLSEAQQETRAEMIELTARAEHALREIYDAGGINLGMNLGQCAGAGVAAHIHMHVLPRWHGDASFITTIGETRLVPEELETTYDKLKEALAK